MEHLNIYEHGIDPDNDSYEHICEYCEAELPGTGDVVFESDGN